MNDQNPKSKIGQILEQLQEESWQLELLISGFAIFLLAGSYESLQEFLIRTSAQTIGLNGGFEFQALTGMILFGSWFFLLTNLILHVVLRGLWISAIGLRYISDDVDFDTLNFSDKFDRFLRKKIPSFDHFIEGLEKICSVIFAFTFIIVFIILSLGLFIVFVAFFTNLVLPQLETVVSVGLHHVISVTITIFIMVSALMYFVDFVTLGWLKRVKLTARLYFPIYRFYSWMTLSFLYRPLYYNLIDNRFGRKVGFLLVPYIFIAIAVATLKNVTHLYFPTEPTNLIIHEDSYADQLKKDAVINHATIPSKFVDKGFLELFIPYLGQDDPSIAYYCSDITPHKTTGLKLSFFHVSRNTDKYSPADSLLHCISLVNQVMIDDSLYSDLNYHFYLYPNRSENGLLTAIDIDHLDRGEHRLRVDKMKLTDSDSVYWETLSDFPFWKE